MFEALVKEGASLQRKTQAVAEEKISDVTSKMSTMAGDVTASAGQQWDKLESIFEERTAKAMGKLGVPTKKDFEALAKRVEELSATLAKQPKATAKAAGRGPPGGGRRRPATRAPIKRTATARPPTREEH